MLSRECWKDNPVLPARPAAAAFAPAATTRTTSATTAAFARNHGAGFVHYQGAAHQVATVAGFHRTVGGGVVVDFNESKPASLTGETITHHVYAIDGYARLREEIR
jgi:hypothetical protein